MAMARSFSKSIDEAPQQVNYFIHVANGKIRTIRNSLQGWKNSYLQQCTALSAETRGNEE